MLSIILLSLLCAKLCKVSVAQECYTLEILESEFQISSENILAYIWLETEKGSIYIYMYVCMYVCTCLKDYKIWCESEQIIVVVQDNVLF